MEIQIYLTNGRNHVLRVENDRMAQEIVSAIRPGKFFQQSVLQVQGSQAALTINPTAIEFVEFTTTILPEWPSERSFESLEPGSPPGRSLQPIRLVSSEDYARLMQELAAHRQEDETVQKPGMEIDAVAELCFKSGNVRHIHVHGTLGPGEDRRRFSLKVFDAPAMEVRWEQGGFTLVNPKNVETFTITPGPTERSPLVWRAEFLIEQ